MLLSLRTPISARPPTGSRSSDTHLTARGEDALPWISWRCCRSSPAYRYVWINSGDGDASDITAHVVSLGAGLELLEL